MGKGTQGSPSEGAGRQGRRLAGFLQGFHENGSTTSADGVSISLPCSGNGMLSIKTGDFPLHQQKLQGFVVGFKVRGEEEHSERGS